MGKPNYYRVLLTGDWELTIINEDREKETIRAKKGDIFASYGGKDFAATRAFERVDVTPEYMLARERWTDRAGATPEEFAKLVRSNHSKARTVVADLCRDTPYAPTSQKGTDLLALVTALHNLDPLPLAADEDNGDSDDENDAK